MALKTSLHKAYAVDTSKEESGVWQDFDGGVSICVRRLNSEAALKAREDAEKPYLVHSRNKALTDEQQEEIATKQLAYGVIADWKGITEPVLDAEGNPVIGEDKKPVVREIAYSGDLAYEFLSDPELKDFRVILFQLAADRSAYKKGVDEDGVKN